MKLTANLHIPMKNKSVSYVPYGLRYQVEACALRPGNGAKMN